MQSWTSYLAFDLPLCVGTVQKTLPHISPYFRQDSHSSEGRNERHQVTKFGPALTMELAAPGLEPGPSLSSCALGFAVNHPIEPVF